MKKSFDSFKSHAIDAATLKSIKGGITCYYYNGDGQSFSESSDCKMGEDACDHYGSTKYANIGFKGKCLQ